MKTLSITSTLLLAGLTITAISVIEAANGTASAATGSATGAATGGTPANTTQSQSLPSQSSMTGDHVISAPGTPGGDATNPAKPSNLPKVGGPLDKSKAPGDTSDTISTQRSNLSDPSKTRTSSRTRSKNSSSKKSQNGSNSPSDPNNTNDSDK